MTDRRYPSKLILFGEYTSLIDSATLGVPTWQYYGSWSDEKSRRSEFSEEFQQHLLQSTTDFLHIDLLKSVLEGPPYYRSNIPFGYGLGSSGALSAAIYDLTRRETDLNPAIIRNQLSIIESFFHGASSGFDPLLSLLGEPLIKRSSGKIEVAPTLADRTAELPIYLIDSGVKRRQKNLIPWFMGRTRQDPKAYQHLADLNNQMIDKLLNNDSEGYAELFKEISTVQLRIMDAMILGDLKSWWQEGLKSNTFYAKICGAGGGGYYFVYSNESSGFEQGRKMVKLSTFTSRE